MGLITLMNNAIFITRCRDVTKLEICSLGLIALKREYYRVWE